MALPALRPLSKGEILDGAFTLYRRHFIAFFAVMVAIMVPAAAARLAAPEWGGLANSVLYFAAWGATVRVASDAVLGRPPSIGGAIGTGARKLVPLLLNYVVLLLAIGVGLVLLVVPGLLVAIMGFAIAPVIVIENRSYGLGRSRALAKGAWGKIAILTLLSAIIVSLPSIAVFGFAGVFSSATADALLGSAPTSTPIWVDLTAMLLTCFTAPFSNSVLTLLYYDQRVRKEGLGIELQAASIGRAIPAAG